jgi:hypothetical protein
MNQEEKRTSAGTTVTDGGMISGAMKVKIVKTTKKVNAATTMLTDFVEQAAHARLRRS